LAVFEYTTNTNLVKWIYINIGGTTKLTSIYKKIDGQIASIKKNGIAIESIFLSTAVAEKTKLTENITLYPVQKAERKYFPQWQLQYYYIKTLDKLLKEHDADYYYLRYPFAHPALLRLIKKYPSKFIIEYNAIQILEIKCEEKTKTRASNISSIMAKLQDYARPLFYEWLYAKPIIKYAHKTLGVTKQISEYYKKYKSKTIAIGNGIATANYLTRIAPPIINSKIKLLILDGTSTQAPWQGTDRLINSIITHKMENVVEILIAGNNTLSSPHSFVTHLGYLNHDELNNIFNQVHIGTGNLCIFRKGLLEGAVLKNREYAARGLPILLAHDDIDISKPAWHDYVYKIKNNEDIINLPKVHQWLINLYKQKPQHAFEMATLAKKTLDFEKKLMLL